MAATPTLFSLLVHHGPTTSIIHDVDRNRYLYMDMCQDVLEIALVDLPANISADINIKCEIPNSRDIMNVNNDIDMLYFEYLEEELHINASDEEWQVRSEEEINSDSEYEVDGSVVEKHSEGEDDGLSNNGSDEVHEDGPNSDVDIEQIHVDRAIQGRRFIVEEGSIRLENGMVFTNVNKFREALRDFAIQEGCELVRVKNDKARVTTHCASDRCPWRIHATITPDEITFRIKTYVSQHTCIRTSKNSNATSTWIARKVRSKLYAESDLRYSSMQQDLLEKFGVQVSQRRLYRAKRKAREEDYGNHARSYKKIPAYANVVLETNLTI
nr:hypothetical protein CFP56_17147 [Quercus suber]